MEMTLFTLRLPSLSVIFGFGPFSVCSNGFQKCTRKRIGNQELGSCKNCGTSFSLAIFLSFLVN